jgi:hypothetical protein
MLEKREGSAACLSLLAGEVAFGAMAHARGGGRGVGDRKKGGATKAGLRSTGQGLYGVGDACLSEYQNGAIRVDCGGSGSSYCSI